MRNARGGIRKEGLPSEDVRALNKWIGYMDFKLGKPYNKLYEKMNNGQQRNYERGRLLAATIKGSWGEVPMWKQDEFLSHVIFRLDMDVIEDVRTEIEWQNSLVRK